MTQAVYRMFTGGRDPWVAFTDDPMLEGFVKKNVKKPKSAAGKALEFTFEFVPLGTWAGMKIASHAGKVTTRLGIKSMQPGGPSFLKVSDEVDDVAKEGAEVLQSGYKKMIEKVVKEKEQLAADLGNHRVTDGRILEDVIKEQLKQDPNLLKKAGIRPAIEQFRTEGSIRTMWELEKALKAKIPPNITTTQAQAYLQIKMALSLSCRP